MSPCDFPESLASRRKNPEGYQNEAHDPDDERYRQQNPAQRLVAAENRFDLGYLHILIHFLGLSRQMTARPEQA